MSLSQERQLVSLRRAGVRLTGRQWAAGFAVVVMLLTTLPYLLGFASQGDGWRFTGFVFAVEDGNSYIAKMQSGAAGEWLFRTPYSNAVQAGALVYLPFILLGKLAAPPGMHEQLVALYHLFRFAAGFLAILATYDLIAYFIPDERRRLYGLALAVLGGGLGWVLLLLGQDTWLGSMPLEFYSPETFGFLHYYGLPHLALARAAMLWGLLAYLRCTAPEGKTGWRQAAGIGLLWLLVAVCQPLTAICMGMVIGLYLFALAARNLYLGSRMDPAGWPDWRDKLRFAFQAVLIPAPFLLYNALLFSLDPFMKTWAAQNRITSPHLAHYLLAYGVLLPFLPLGARNLLRGKPVSGWFLLAWIMAVPVLAYAPLNVQRRLVEGVWVAMVIVALWSLRQESFPGVRKRLFLFTSLLAFPSTLILLFGGMLSAMNPGMPLHRPALEAAAFVELGQQASAGSLVMASYTTGNALPAWAPLRVVIGHGPESANLEAMERLVQRFYDESTSEAERRQILAGLGVNYVFNGPQEAELGEWNASQSVYLREIIRRGAYVIYEVVG